MNFAQGEMAMFSTFVALAILNQGLPLPVAFIGALVFSAALGMATERFFLRAIDTAPHFSKVILTLGIVWFAVRSALGLARLRRGEPFENWRTWLT